jgi:hypothetical protein
MSQRESRPISFEVRAMDYALARERSGVVSAEDG